LLLSVRDTVGEKRLFVDELKVLFSASRSPRGVDEGVVSSLSESTGTKLLLIGDIFSFSST